MKKIIYLLATLVIFTNFAFSAELKGGVSFDVKSARNYLLEGQIDNVDISKHPFFQHDDKVERVVYSYNNNGDIIAATVQYKDDHTTAYIYGRDNNLKYIEKYDRPVNLYPHRGYRYNLEGKLTAQSLTVSPTELFRFSPTGKLLIHSVNGIMYDDNGKKYGKAISR